MVDNIVLYNSKLVCINMLFSYMCVCVTPSLVPRPPPAFFDFILQMIKAGDKAGDEALSHLHCCI